MFALVAGDRRSPLWIGALAVLLLLMAGVVGTVMLQSRADSLAQGSQLYADRTGTELAANWSSESLLAQASPELRTRLGEQDLADLTAQMRRLGPLWKYLGATGRLNGGFLAWLGVEPTASYQAKASYAGGVVTFDLGLVRHAGRWEIDRFHVDFLDIRETGESG